MEHVAPARRSFWWALSVIGGGLTGFVLLAVLLNGAGGPTLPERWAHLELVTHRTAWASAIATTLSFLFSETVLPFLALGLAGLWWWRTKDWLSPVIWLGSLALAAGLVFILKHVFARARPAAADLLGAPDPTWSFPSGHTIAAFAFFAVGAFLLARGRGGGRTWVGLAVTVVAVAAMAASRMYLGYHWPGDVAASTMLGLVVLGIVMLLVQVFEWHGGTTPERPGPSTPSR